MEHDYKLLCENLLKRVEIIEKILKQQTIINDTCISKMTEILIEQDHNKINA